jgi:release factor glutamine methyltransferase
MQVFELLKSGSLDLRNNKINTHQLDSEIILSHILKETRENLLTNAEREVTKSVVELFNKKILRRSSREPVAYILQIKEFWSKDFFVNKNTLIPRPETELLSENIIKIFKKKTAISILDIGTGTGCILLSILSEIKGGKGTGIDISKKAIDVAKANSKKFFLQNRTRFYPKSFVDLYGCKYDLIVSNPPYIKTSEIKNLSDDIKRFEPKIALDGGNDGLDVVKKIIYKSRTILKKFGSLALEIGNGQYYKVSHILKDQGFRVNVLVKDYQNNIRCIIARLEN